MSKPVIKVSKSYSDGHIQLSVKASAGHIGQSIASTVAVAVSLADARALQTELAAAVEKEAARLQTKVDQEARRKAWRDREVAAGRMQVFSANEFFKR